MGTFYEIMDILYTTGKGKLMDTVEISHIQWNTKKQANERQKHDQTERHF
jgi:hypothetical protein